MTKIERQGRIQGDTWVGPQYATCGVGGTYAIFCAHERIETHLGPIEFPDANLKWQPLFHRQTTRGGFRIAGQSWGTGRVLEWDGTWKLFDTITPGTSSVIYDRDGDLCAVKNDGAPRESGLVLEDLSGVGVNGYRYVTDRNELITGDATYAPRAGIAPAMNEWTNLSLDGDTLSVGQGNQIGGVLFWDGAAHRQLVTGSAKFIRAERQGDNLAIAFWGESGVPTSCYWLTRAEVNTLPIVNATPGTPVPPPPVPPSPPETPMTNPLRIDGREFYRGDTLFVPRFVSGLTLLTKTHADMSAYLDWTAATGFNGVRVFAGALAWAGQTPESARAALTTLLNLVAERDLIIELTLLTDTGTGYDMRDHLEACRDLVRPFKGRVLVECANEIGHPSQHPSLTATQVRVWGSDIFAPHGILWAVGAPLATDEPDAAGYFGGQGGDYITSHLDRGRDPWNMARRVRELFAIVEAHNVPVLNNEPIGAAEVAINGKRLDQPAIFYTLGALERAFPGVGGVHHSTAGLNAVVPGPVQQACADAYIRAHTDVALTLQARGRYKNVGHEGSPYQGVNVGEQPGSERVRLYAFIKDGRGVAVDVGVKTIATSAPLTNGWRYGTDWHVSPDGPDGRVCAVRQLTTGTGTPTPPVPPTPPTPPPSNDILDQPLTPAYPVGYAFWIKNRLKIQDEAEAWYYRAFKRHPADEDVSHGLWRALNEGERWRTLRGAFEETWPGGNR